MEDSYRGAVKGRSISEMCFMAAFGTAQGT